LFEFQSSLLRLCADNCEFVARNYDERVEAFSTTVEQQQLGALLQNIPAPLSEGSEDHGGPLGRKEVSPSSDEAQQSKLVIDQMSDPAVEAAGTLSEKSIKVAADQAKMAVVKHAPIPIKEAAKSVRGAANARQQAAKKPSHKADADKRVSSTKKIPRKTMKSRKKTGPSDRPG
jgi:hypothetical protein